MALVRLSCFLVLALSLSLVRGHVSYLGVPNQLHHVRSLFVRPSTDGTTGDLYVAATEDHGVKSQWLTEQPINFLPPQQHVPVAYTQALTTSHLPDESVVTNQKRAVISSPPIKYAYALPAQTEGSVPYPYAIPTAPSAAEGTECEPGTTPVYPHYPYHPYYAHFMSAFASALNNMKDDSEEEGKTTKAAPAWPSYGYPVQYVMVDPSMWAKTPTTTPAAPTTTPATNAESSNEST
ncbi:uncharacterized protein LOC126367660 [Pectinophora gossypiella]|uniref:uncharacterized protein LOC126367660 n=1 Tax=Pectinophora gossypiella TaxID=13191 RepID=UPI00214ED3DD|nr:uncharacterized protein LOC126367660 [Pectinophora gossypiella]